MSTSTICPNFVQNAWKKELCSNCFKSKDEHQDPAPRPIPFVSSERIFGIIRTTSKSKPKHSVRFKGDISEVIGYGGEDWHSDDEDEPQDTDSGEDELEEEEDKGLKKLTKDNTDFNTNLKAVETGVKKTAQLLLGKPVVDSNGKKQTLMVSVTPFGEEPPAQKKFIKTISHIPISKGSSKESVPDGKQTSVVLTSYTKSAQKDDNIEKSLLDEITETLENNKIQIISRKKPQKELEDPNKENKPVERKTNLTRTPALKRDQEKPVIYQTSTKIEFSKSKEVIPPQSREQAGEPDGRADPSPPLEPPALPLTPPPPLETQTSFLHTEKPKVPAKSANLTLKSPLTKQDSNDSDVSLRNKRRAPKPPEDQVLTRHSFKDEEFPAPRKLLSVSTDNLVDEKRREKIRGRFSLKKFLRMGSNKEEVKFEECYVQNSPKPKLVIVHPSELNGAGVEVVANNEQSSKAKKPPPPPRNNYKPKQELKKQTNSETVYANLGEVRSTIVPNKPQRTASMRENDKNTYEPIENIYDYIQGGSPESKSRLNKRSESSIDVSGDYFKYSSNVVTNNNIPRSMSLTYCGSETESEIYAPYSFYGSESEVAEDDHDWIQNGRTHKLRSRKGRSIVHRNLEDNYGAVVVANHEALVQVLENIQQTNYTQPALRGLKSSPNLRYSDFVANPNSQPLSIGNRTFHSALWNAHQVTLMLSTGTAPSNALSLGTFAMSCVTEFSDLVPATVLSGHHVDEGNLVQANVAVLPWSQINTIQSFSESLRSKPTSEDMWKEPTFIMLQIVNALKQLQAQGTEELPLSLNNFVLCKDGDKDGYQRLCVLQGLLCDTSASATLCACASRALALLQPPCRSTGLLHSLLQNERAVTLTQVKSVLEFRLWGPSDVALGPSVRERELALQRWLDLQRATVLHGLVCARVQLTVHEECHLCFLVRSTARMMCDASMLLEAGGVKLTQAQRGSC